MLRIRTPLQGIYSVALATAILALTPFIIVSSGYAMFLPHIMSDLNASRHSLSIIAALATAGYAFGALLGGDLAQRFPQKYTFLIAEGLFVTGCIIAAVAPGVIVYGTGRDLQGFATGMLLVSAVPPVVQNFPASKVPFTVVFINIAFFGGVCAGPLLGGAVWLGHDWRWFYAFLAGLGAIAFMLGVLALPVREPPNRNLRFDFSAVALALATTVLVFLGAAQLTDHTFASCWFAVPVGVGLICFITLMLTQYHRKQPLSPIKKMWTTLPIIGTLVAMIGGGIFFSLMELTQQFHMHAERQTPWQTGLLLWPLIPGVLVSAALLGALIKTRLLPFLILLGLACILVGGVVIAVMNSQTGGVLTPVAAGLLGFGAGATVSPALFLAGFSLGPRQLGRIFALIEMVRSVFDYVLAPVIVRIAVTTSHGSSPQVAGIHTASRVAIYITVAFIVVGIAVYLLGGVGLPKPDLNGWLGENRPAVRSPNLLAAVRR